MAYQHQDWATVYLNKKPQNQQKHVQSKAQTQTVSSTTNKPAWKIEQQVDSDTGKPIQYISKQDSETLKSMRIALKLTQSELATKLNIKNVKLKDVQDMESGKAVENKAMIASMKRRMQTMLDAQKSNASS